MTETDHPLLPGVRAPGAYQPARPDSLRGLGDHKRHRRFELGELVTLLIEDAVTVRGALEEALRSDGIDGNEAVAAETTVFAEALPGPGELCVQAVFEISDAAELGRRRTELTGLAQCVRLRVGAHVIEPHVDVESAGGAASLLRFRWPKGAELSDDMSFAVEHPVYRARRTLDDDERRELVASIG